MENEFLIVPLMGAVEVVRLAGASSAASSPPSPLPTDSQKKRIAGVTAARRSGRALLRKTANANPADDACFQMMRRNRAIQTHLSYFCSVVRYAITEAQYIAYGEYRKRMAAEEVPAFHKAVTKWAKKYFKDTATAATIGIGARGYVRIYFVTTSANSVQVHDVALKFASYLRHKGFIPVELRPYEEKPLHFLKEKYNNDGITSAEELLRGDLWCECWEVMRAGFALPYRHRTIRTAQSTEVLQKQAYFSPGDSYPLSQTEYERFSQMPSILIEE